MEDIKFLCFIGDDLRSGEHSQAWTSARKSLSLNLFRLLCWCFTAAVPFPPSPVYRLSVQVLQEKHSALLEALKEHLRLIGAEVKINLNLRLRRRFPSIIPAAALPVNSQ